MTLEEQELELAQLKYQILAIGNVMKGEVPASRTLRYRQLEVDFEGISPEELQLDLASFKFQLLVMQKAIENSKAIFLNNGTE
jgi:hypothetical protein